MAHDKLIFDGRSNTNVITKVLETKRKGESLETTGWNVSDTLFEKAIKKLYNHS